MFHDDALAQPVSGVVVHIAWLADRQQKQFQAGLGSEQEYAI